MRSMVAIRISTTAVAALMLGSCSKPAPAPAPEPKLWTDVTAQTIGKTTEWTNKVEIADLNGDSRPDIIFANGGNYAEPGKPEPTRVFFNQGPGKPFVEKTTEIFGSSGNLARVVKARDVNGDGIIDIIIGNTYQTQSRLFLGTGGGNFKEVTKTNLPQMPLSVGDIEIGDVDGDGDLDIMLV